MVFFRQLMLTELVGLDMGCRLMCLDDQIDNSSSIPKSNVELYVHFTTCSLRDSTSREMEVPKQKINFVDTRLDKETGRGTKKTGLADTVAV